MSTTIMSNTIRTTNKVKGFTLMELMITVAIIGIIASIAIPSYQDFINKSRRSEAHAGLAKMALQQEAHRMVNTTFASAFDTDSNPVRQPTSDYYTFSLPAAGDGNPAVSASAYTVIATAKSSQTADTACTPMTVNQAGTKTPTGCW